ncbi:MAG: hypothetical protein ACYSSP_04770 [Planctomycetota bacterium]|jgi:hypothetical protein
MKVKKTIKYGSIVLAAALLLIVVAASLRAEVVQNEKIETTWLQVIPCSDDTVVIGGYIHMLASITEDGAGGYHAKIKTSPSPLKGIVVDGPNVDAKYNGTGVTQTQLNLKKGVTETYVNRYRFVGEGKAPNYSVHETWHITINANGELTAEPVNVKITCK